MVAADDERNRSGAEDSIHDLLDRRIGLLDAGRRRIHVPHVGHLEPVERRHLLKVAVGPDERRLRADLARSEPRAGPGRRAAVERGADIATSSPPGSVTCGRRMKVAGCAKRGDLNDSLGRG